MDGEKRLKPNLFLRMCVALDSARITLEVNHKNVRIDLRTKGFKIQR